MELPHNATRMAGAGLPSPLAEATSVRKQEPPASAARQAGSSAGLCRGRTGRCARNSCWQRMGALAAAGMEEMETALGSRAPGPACCRPDRPGMISSSIRPASLRIEHRKHHLHPAEEVARHPVGAREETPRPRRPARTRRSGCAPGSGRRCFARGSSRSAPARPAAGSRCPRATMSIGTPAWLAR